MERRVFLHDVLRRNAFRKEHRPDNLVGGSGIHVVGSHQIKLLLAASVFAEVVVHRRRRLLDYLKSKDSERYAELIRRLGIRK